MSYLVDTLGSGCYAVETDSGNSYNTHLESHSHVINHFTKYKHIFIHIQLKKTFSTFHYSAQQSEEKYTVHFILEYDTIYSNMQLWSLLQVNLFFAYVVK